MLELWAVGAIGAVVFFSVLRERKRQRRLRTLALKWAGVKEAQGAEASRAALLEGVEGQLDTLRIRLRHFALRVDDPDLSRRICEMPDWLAQYLATSRSLGSLPPAMRISSQLDCLLSAALCMKTPERRVNGCQLVSAVSEWVQVLCYALKQPSEENG